MRRCKYLESDYVCGVKTGGYCENMRFTGHRIEASEFLIPLVDFPPIVFSQVTPMLCMCTEERV